MLLSRLSSSVKAELTAILSVEASEGRLKGARDLLIEYKYSAAAAKLIGGGTYAHSIEGAYYINGTHRKDIARLGKANGCHVCGTKKPCTIYHADHCPPKHLAMTAWFPQIYKSLTGDDLKPRFFRPQCPSCSHEQGSRIAAIDHQAKGLMSKEPGLLMGKSRGGRKRKIHDYASMGKGSRRLKLSDEEED